MTGDWAGSVQIVRTVVDREVPVVVLSNINLIVKIFDDVDSFIPDTYFGSCHRRSSLTPCRLVYKHYT